MSCNACSDFKKTRSRLNLKNLLEYKGSIDKDPTVTRPSSCVMPILHKMKLNVYVKVQKLLKYEIIHELPWITAFWSSVKWVANDFHEWCSECIILFLTRYFVAHDSSENNHRSLISPLSLAGDFFYLALWRHRSWSVTSREGEVVALWRHVRRLFLHAQTGTNAIFTGE